MALSSEYAWSKMQQVNPCPTSHFSSPMIKSSCNGSPSAWSQLSVAAGKPRGYAFIEYEHKNNMKEAYKRADGKKVEGKRVVVDVERGRTVPNWYVLHCS